jgi:caffeoyl-CoA O-methyltransferase
MLHLTSEEINNYCASFSSPEDEILLELNRQTHLQTTAPIMLSGHLQGRFLSMISYMIKPRYILEIGTFTGYSALCLAEGLQENGLLISIDSNEETTSLAKSFINKKNETRITLLLGDAATIIPTLDYTFDLIFIDADKPNYANYADLVFEKLAVGGYMLADNVLFHGEVLDINSAGKNGKAMHAYNQKMTSDNRFEHVLLPLRDGILISRKK